MFMAILSWINGLLCCSAWYLLVVLHVKGYEWLFRGDVMVMALVMLALSAVNAVIGLYYFIEAHGGMKW